RALRSGDEDVPMRPWWPGFEIRAFELDRAYEQAWHVAAVRVFAADADFVDAGQVVDVVLLHHRSREVVDRAFEDVLAKAGSSHGLWRSDRCERAAAIAPQTQVNAYSRLTLLKDGKTPGQSVVRGQRGENDAVEFFNRVVLDADFKRGRLEPDHQEGWLIQCAGEFAVPEAQRKIWRGAASNGSSVFGIALPATLGAGLEQALARLDQGGDFGCVQRAAIEADCADFAIERLRDFEVGSLGVELGAAHVCFRCEETVDVEKRFVVATADDNGDVAPLIPMEDPGAGGERGGRGLGPPRRVGTQ